MKKFIAFLVIVVFTALISLVIAPMAYVRYSSMQRIEKAKAAFAEGKVEEGVEYLRTAIHAAEDMPLVRGEALKEIPGILYEAADSQPRKADALIAFASRNGIEFPCQVRTRVFSSLLQSTYPLFFKKTDEAGKQAKLDEIYTGLASAQTWLGDCDMDSRSLIMFEKYKKAYGKLAGTPYVAPLPVEEPPAGAEAPPPPAGPRPNILTSIKTAPGKALAGLKGFASSILNRKKAPAPPPPAAQPAPQATGTAPATAQPAQPAPAQAQPAAAPPPKAEIPEAKPAAPPAKKGPPPAESAPAPVGKKAKPLSFLTKISSDLRRNGVKAIRVEASGDDAIRVGIKSDATQKQLINQLKAVFEITEAHISDNRMIDRIPYLRVDVYSQENTFRAGWTVTMNDYRLYRKKLISGDEFERRMKPMKPTK